MPPRILKPLPGFQKVCPCVAKKPLARRTLRFRQEKRVFSVLLVVNVFGYRLVMAHLVLFCNLSHSYVSNKHTYIHTYIHSKLWLRHDLETSRVSFPRRRCCRCFFRQDEHFASLVRKALHAAIEIVGPGESERVVPGESERVGPGDADRGKAGIGFAVFIYGRSFEYGCFFRWNGTSMVVNKRKTGQRLQQRINCRTKHRMKDVCKPIKRAGLTGRIIAGVSAKR